MDFSSNCVFDRMEEQGVKQEARCPPIGGGIAKRYQRKIVKNVFYLY